MVDLHNHILPGIDDGARNLSESLIMARIAVKQGTTIMAATPHRFYNQLENQGPFVQDGADRLQKSLDRHEIPLRIVPGIELTMKPDTVESLRSGRVIPLCGAGGRCVLIEPPFDSIPSHALPLLEEVLSLNLTPILAHPERNSCIQKSLEFVEACAALGIVIQLTAGSIVGKFGLRPQECAERIARRRDWKIIIASDAHDVHERTPGDMSAAMDRVAAWIGDESAAKIMVDDLPKSLVC